MSVLSPKKVQIDISKDLILSKISEEQLFQYYIPSLKKLNKPFSSELRKDKTPSAIVSNKGNKLHYHDFATGENYDIWNYIMSKYKCTYFEALNIINNDQKFGVIKVNPTILNIKSEPTNCLYKSRDWQNRDLEYWSQFNITREILEKFWIKPLEAYWIGENYFKMQDLAYIMPECDSNKDWKIKIYCPLRNKGEKFPFSNDGGCIYGLRQLPETGDVLFITSSKKDIMTLYSLGYSAIAFTSESTKGVITKELMDHLKGRFKKIYPFNDFDNVGIIASYHLVRDWQLNGMLFTYEINSKDPSDGVLNKGIEWLKLKIKVFLENN